ncbi:MAG: IS3 family transposase [Thermoplasmatales archaeon]|nr:IS3 family transposase [Thermoplasmatales archaeon]
MIFLNLSEFMTVREISRISGIPLSTYYYQPRSRTVNRIDSVRAKRITDLALERPTYGYRRIWAVLRNEGTRVNRKTVARILNKNNLSLPAAKHKNRTKRRNLFTPDAPDQLWETDITYIPTLSGMTYLMCIKDCFSKEWQGYLGSAACTASDAVGSVDDAVSRTFDGSFAYGSLRVDNGPQYCAPRNIYDLPMEVWFRKVWEHPNSYGHGYVREDMAEAARMQNRRPHQRRTHTSTVRPYMGEPSRLYAAKAILHFSNSHRNAASPVSWRWHAVKAMCNNSGDLAVSMNMPREVVE